MTKPEENKEADRKHARTAEEMGMELVLATTRSLFISRKTLLHTSFERGFKHGKLMLRRSLESPGVRHSIGASSQQWRTFSEVFSLAIPTLEVQSIAIDDNTNGGNGSYSAVMAANYDTLTKDLERLNDLLLIARNCLATTQMAQNLAGESLLDQQVLKLIDLCVRVTARGFDGESGSKIEQQWANVIGLYKKLLITCLQFLHNFVMKNEQRKLLLWLDLFANSRIANEYASGTLPPGLGRDHFEAKLAEVQANGKANGQVDNREKPAKGTSASQQSAESMNKNNDIASKEGGQQNIQETPADSASKDAVGTRQEMSLVKPRTDEEKASMAQAVRENRPHVPHVDTEGLPYAATQKDLLFGAVRTERGDEFGALRTPESAAVTLKAAKEQLMARLADSSMVAEDGSDHDSAHAASIDIDSEPQGRFPIEGEDGYEVPGESGDQERGLLTDIPLVLGPQEIEALPMIIQIGVCPGLGGWLHGRDMQSMRCNILLAGEAGRNLLRELLIFIAAWDLQDDELYFKLMMHIMEAILENGLMPYAYQIFAEVKDIVSPAQSMVIKILTQIFRGEKGLATINAKDKEAKKKENPHADASRRVDIYIVRYVFTMFRSSIIPETCALIYLQGQIKAGAALPEDFPLNLWDMERVYEGVYQFLEFFAVLTESVDWKDLLVNWEIVSELVTLLRELEASIPKAPLSALPQSVAEAEAEAAAVEQEAQRLSEASTATHGSVAVERPFDITPNLPTSNTTSASAGFPLLDGGSLRPPPLPNTSSVSDAASIESADPSDFEWRNLKKLVILVLSSLVWKCPTVQDQIRQYGGVELVLACCNYDGHNPFIREHAVMCLRFVLENNAENQEIVRRVQNQNKNARSGNLGDEAVEEVAGEVLGEVNGIHDDEKTREEEVVEL